MPLSPGRTRAGSEPAEAVGELIDFAGNTPAAIDGGAQAEQQRKQALLSVSAFYR